MAYGDDLTKINWELDFIYWIIYIGSNNPHGFIQFSENNFNKHIITFLVKRVGYGFDFP